MIQCLHVARNPLIKRARITPESTENAFELCMDCAYIWSNDKRRNPVHSEGYNIYFSSDSHLPKNQWTRVNDRPIPPTPDGKMEFNLGKVAGGGSFYVTAINAIGLESDPGKVVFIPAKDAPKLVLKSLLVFGETTDEGKIVEAVTLPWFEILELLKNDPEAAFQIPADKWEEIVAGVYHKSGFDEVTLTPRSGDYGRDVIAVKKGVGTIRVIDQIKAYKPGRLVDANDVRALVGVLHGDGASKRGRFTKQPRQ